MKTDISLIDKADKQKIIIDAKYYADIFLKSFNAQKIRSGHLYQLFTYLNHSSDIYFTRGILVYPTNGFTVDETYTVPIQIGSQVQESTIRIFTLDLNQSWQGIYDRMFELLNP
jgi:5-methylcytosine-specific restriction enzyme subunit McrC